MASQYDTNIFKNEVWDLLAELGVDADKADIIAWYGVHGAIVEMSQTALSGRLTAKELRALTNPLVRWFEHNAAIETISIGLTYNAVKESLLDGGEL